MSTTVDNVSRLPLSVRPTHYDLVVKTDLASKTFEGYVTIELNIEQDTSTIIFNVAELSFSHLSLRSSAFTLDDVDVASALVLDAKNERGTIYLPSSLQAGSTATLTLAFKATLTDKMKGYYLSNFEHEGQQSCYALTHLQPTAARYAFPCWDEPAIKATFKVSLISRADTVNLNNMSIASEDVFKYDTLEPKHAIGPTPGEWKITRFHQTPPMSTYIVAFANGPFAHLEDAYTSALSGTTRPLRVYATPDAISQCQFALDIKKKLLPIYEELFGIEYPLPKLDTLVAHDFEAGAMENWGLITGRKEFLMMDSAKASLLQKKEVTRVMAHEIGHMWFGNITTPAWWDTLYLNEGFATLLGEFVVLDKIQPDWKVFTQFIISNLNVAMELDSKLSSHPVEVECPDAESIDQIFDDLSYCKAAAVLRMLYEYVGEEQFVKGVSIYLKKKLYGNSESKDLWEGIAEATGLDIAKMMDGWITKVGFPVVTVTEVSDGIHVRQDRYLETGAANPEDNEYIWTIPLSLLHTSEDGTTRMDKRIVLDSREMSIKLDTSKPFKLNADTTGMFLVFYAGPQRLAILSEDAAQPGSAFSLSDRLGLLFEAMRLAKSGHGRVSDALAVMYAFRNETDASVWRGIASNITALRRLWGEDESIGPLLQAFARSLFSPLVERLGWTYAATDSSDVVSLRTLAIESAARAEDESVVAELRKRFAEYVATGDDSGIPADLERITYLTAMIHGGEVEYDTMMKILTDPRSSPSSSLNAILGLTANPQPALIDRTLAFTLAPPPTGAREQDLFTFFKAYELSGVCASDGRLRRFFMQNYGTYVARLEGGTSGVRYLVEAGFSNILNKAQLAEAEAFFETQDTAKYNQTLAQVFDAARANIAWLERSTDDIREWLAEWKTKTTSTPASRGGSPSSLGKRKRNLEDLEAEKLK